MVAVNSRDSKILIVDDDENAVEILALYFGMGDFEVERAFSGEEAVEKAIHAQPDVVLLDINMPGIGGIAALSQSKKKYPSLGVIMVTGFPEEEIALRTMKLGAYDFATKPIDINYLDLCVSILAISSDH